MSHDGWIIEGVSSIVREAADLVVFIDLPRRVCAWRSSRRTLCYLRSGRAELPEACPEWRIYPTLLRIIRDFPNHAGRAILEEARREPDRYRVVPDPAAARAAVLAFARAAPAA